MTIANEIIGDTVKSAFVMKLRTVFPSITVYREAISRLEFPHFFVFQLTVDTQEDSYNRWWINYLINVRFRTAAQPETVPNLQDQLDNIGFDMLAELETVEFMGDTFRIANPRIEKVDGVLQYFANITIRAKKPLPEVVKQLTLETQVQIANE